MARRYVPRGSSSTPIAPDEFKGALLATEIGTNEWTGVWTFDPSVVDRVAAYLDETYGT